MVEEWHLVWCRQNLRVGHNCLRSHETVTKIAMDFGSKLYTKETVYTTTHTFAGSILSPRPSRLNYVELKTSK